MEKEFIPYEESLALKDLGFNEKCFGFYTSYLGSSEIDLTIMEINWNSGKLMCLPESFPVDAPIYQQAFRWFREKHNLHSPIRKVVGNRDTEQESISWTITNTPWETISDYEEAELECLKKLIEIVKNK